MKRKGSPVYSVQGCAIAPPPDPLRTSLCHLPLFATSRVPSPLGSRAGAQAPHGPARGGRCLSIDHNDSKPQKSPASDCSPPSLGRLRIVPRGSISQCPANPSRRVVQKGDEVPPGQSFDFRKRTKRGKVLSYTEKSRRVLQRLLATVDRHAPAWTMALTCPGEWTPERNLFAKACFLVLCKRMTASRDPLIRSIGVFWKQEIQRRQAVHFHLCLWGLTSSSVSHVQGWIASQWNALVCVGLDPDSVSSHLKFHLHTKNFEEVRDMAGYFAKYLGKDEKAVAAEHVIPGRWWGRFNSSCIPFAPEVSLEIPWIAQGVSVLLHRLYRKLRQVKANEGKHRAQLRAVGRYVRGGPDKGQPCYSQFLLSCSRRRHVLREEINEMLPPGQSLGPYRFPSAIKHYPVTLVGPFVPAFAAKAARWAMDSFRDRLDSDSPSIKSVSSSSLAYAASREARAKRYDLPADSPRFGLGLVDNVPF